MAIDYTRRAPAEPEPAAPVPAPAISLSKITLTKAAPSVSLTKESVASGVLRVNLNWQSGAPAKGFLAKLTARPVDLDLACLYEFTDGSKGVVQALGNSFEAVDDSSPRRIIWLDGDDRSGQATGGENLTIDLSQTAAIRRVLVFAMIYEGVSNWAAADGVVTLTPPSGAQIEVRLDEADAQSRICAIAEITNGPSGLQVRREVNYIRGGHKALDEAYGWGLSWTPGRK
ncbi:tellurite resistance protein TerA [Sanguibacter gelidistatuariae]|uniref:Tellurite resistance protein TerA n=1 Tax=Sanguibacter gelidistatuariae TaxID=1814289 RepID=A0A1G6HHE3_9MICO|nr:tellurium resistance protein [Sanguibacter gelidistatuariae]SDB93669.1 tellurite resistance protein TerA [Sanguibacter gelidistatuariae]